MIKACIEPTETAAWKKWCADGTAAANEHLSEHQEGKSIVIKEALYKRRKQDIFAMFHGKCAYCEALFILDQTGDVEHFRPKAKVTDINNLEVPGHPGYFWLAYDWHNLLPSCNKCNRPSKDRDGKILGKWNRFPVRDTYATTPEAIAGEAPLLLNPASDDPSAHIKFDPDTGVVFSDTPEGKTCIEVLGLNREGLPEARRDVYENVIARAGEQNSALRNGDVKSLDKHTDYLLKHKRGEAEYAMAGRAGLGFIREVLKKQSELLSE